MPAIADDRFRAILELVERYPDRWSDETLSIALATNFAIDATTLEYALDEIETAFALVVN